MSAAVPGLPGEEDGASPVLVTDHDGVVHVQLNRPAKRNAFSPLLVERLEQAIRDASSARAAAIVLSGAGPSFCSGGDLDLARVLLADPARYDPVWERLIRGANTIVGLLREAPCVTIAAVEGAAVGAGLGLALATDLRVLGRGARLIPGWVERSASPDSGGSYFLSRFLGPGAMAAVAISGRVIDAESARSLLIADDVVEDGRALDRALEMAAALRTRSPASLRAVRCLADESTAHGLAEHLQLETELMRDLRRGKERQAALASWQGRRADGNGTD